MSTADDQVTKRRAIAPLPAYILAGGRSSRFGSDKARAMVEGRSLLERLADALRALAAEPIVVADRADKYADLGLRTIADLVPGCGPVGGLHAALCDLAARRGAAPETPDALLLAACDCVVLRPGWIEPLAAALARGAPAAAFGAARWEPVPGLYSLRVLPALVELIQASQAAPPGERGAGADAARPWTACSLAGLLERVGAWRVPLPADWPALAHANTPAELAQALRAPPARRGG